MGGVSGIYGIVRFDGGAVEAVDLIAMRKSLCEGGAAPVAERMSAGAGLGRVAFSGSPGPSSAGPLPWARPGTVVVAAARLDYRDELSAELGIDAEESRLWADDDLVRAAFARWGEAAPRHLFGDWSFGAWDERQRTLFLARDQMGNTGLFYVFRPPLLAFASTINALTAMPGWHFEMDEWMLARYLTVFPLPDEERGNTIWRDIRFLLPAQTLRFKEGQVYAHSYWELGVRSGGCLRPAEGWVEEFLHRFRAAVRSRLGGGMKVASTLSSGLDSGAVTALAAEALMEGGGSLTAFTSVPVHPSGHPDPGRRDDEWPLAAAVSARWPNIVHIPIRSERTTPVGAVQRAVAIQGVPLHAAANQFWMLEIHEEAQRRGIGRLLTGQLGNGGVSWSGGGFVFDLFTRGHWMGGIKALKKWRDHHRTTWYRTLRRHILPPLLKPLWRKRHLFLKPGQAPWAGYAAIRPAFAARLGLQEAMRAQRHDPSFSRRIPTEMERWRTVWVNGTMVGPIYHATSLKHGFYVLDPTADARLLEYCFRVPETEDVYNGGERMLIRRAMAGILPPEVQWNRVRGIQAADLAYRLLDHPAETEDALGVMERSALAAEYLDIPALRRSWEDLQAAVTRETSSRASILLLRGLMAGFFLEDSVKIQKGKEGK